MMPLSSGDSGGRSMGEGWSPLMAGIKGSWGRVSGNTALPSGMALFVSTSG